MERRRDILYGSGAGSTSQSSNRLNLETINSNNTTPKITPSTTDRSRLRSVTPAETGPIDLGRGGNLLKQQPQTGVKTLPYQLDENLKPYLLEVNTRPYMHEYNRYDRIIKSNLLVDTLNIAGITLFSHDKKHKALIPFFLVTIFSHLIKLRLKFELYDKTIKNNK